MMRIAPSPSLAPLTTLRIGGSALAEIRLDAPADFDRLPDALARIGGEPRVLGGGSNLLIAEGELPLVLVRSLCGAGQEPVILGESADKAGQTRVIIRAGAGLRMPALLAWCAGHGLSGLEGLIGVPGRVGGAVAMNAGAYGDTVGGRLTGLTVFTPERGVRRLSSGEWSASYRHFALSAPCAWFAVLEAELSLTVSTPDRVRAAMGERLTRKRAAQPVTMHTAGCVFKNPGNLSAGRLLDEAGLRGARRGPVYLSGLHANFLVHDIRPDRADTKGSFAAAAELLAEARETVARRTGINLDMEVKVWPCPLF
ncbi:MAG: FAD-binding protein [Desulfovibrionaceae bacterium]|nr:FAD-binding protein [Desulfovibrionaceae bacterium]